MHVHQPPSQRAAENELLRMVDDDATSRQQIDAVLGPTSKDIEVCNLVEDTEMLRTLALAADASASSKVPESGGVPSRLSRP